MTVELRDLEYFAAIAETGNLGRAAELLNLSQPALSRSLRRLEQATRSKIVARTPKGVELTAAGTALLASIGKLRLAQDEVMRTVADIGNGLSGHVRVGVTPGTLEELLSRASGRLLKDATRLKLTVQVGYTPVLLAALRAGQLDLILATTIADAGAGIAQEHLCVEEYAVVASANHRLARRKRVMPGELAQEQWSSPDPLGGMQREFLRTLVELGLPPINVVMVTNTPSMRLSMIAESNLLGFHARSSIRRASRYCKLAEIKVDGINLRRHNNVIYRQGGYLSPAAQRLIALLKVAATEDE
jgi:DNA-binding transcriptional LysR family regulator